MVELIGLTVEKGENGLQFGQGIAKGISGGRLGGDDGGSGTRDIAVGTRLKHRGGQVRALGRGMTAIGRITE